MAEPEINGTNDAAKAAENVANNPALKEAKPSGLSKMFNGVAKWAKNHPKTTATLALAAGISAWDKAWEIHDRGVAVEDHKQMVEQMQKIMPSAPKIAFDKKDGSVTLTTDGNKFVAKTDTGEVCITTPEQSEDCHKAGTPSESAFLNSAKPLIQAQRAGHLYAGGVNLQLATETKAKQVQAKPLKPNS